jgi:hypothetical protein
MHARLTKNDLRGASFVRFAIVWAVVLWVDKQFHLLISSHSHILSVLPLLVGHFIAFLFFLSFSSKTTMAALRLAQHPIPTTFRSFFILSLALRAAAASRLPEYSLDSKLLPFLKVRRGGSSTNNVMPSETRLKIVFSDLDGTLIHYPEKEINEDDDNDPRLLKFPPSSTGMVGLISVETLRLCQRFRQEHDVKLVLVSGMRWTTLQKRLPYLPRADAYCCEAGGRIFYPVSTTTAEIASDTTFPVRYAAAGDDTLKPFCLVEDMEWRRRMEQLEAAGPNGFIGNDSTDQELGSTDEPIPLEDRQGALWSFARRLIQQGLVLDTDGYATCFRVNRKQQPTAEALAAFDKLLQGEIEHPDELGSSVNLGCIDFYPRSSGKRHW